LKSSFVLNGLRETKEEAVIVIVPTISEHSIYKKQRINDDDGLDIWLSKFRKREIASYDLLSLGDLNELIEAKLPVKIAITWDTEKIWKAKMNIFRIHQQVIHYLELRAVYWIQGRSYKLYRHYSETC
jgi:hypothetical protein